MGFHDYAGSNCIHMVGGICALIGAAFLGPRIGKFSKDKDGKITKVNAIPGHNLVIGSLGVFILWLGWYGFNGAAATDVPTLGSIFLNNRSSGSSNCRMYGIYMDQIWKTGCIDVSERIFSRTGSNYRTL